MITCKVRITIEDVIKSLSDQVETVEIDGEILEVERERHTFKFDEENEEYRTVGIDLDSVNIDRELDILGLGRKGENEHGRICKHECRYPPSP